jgi:phage baseplate assembly protein W
MATAQIKKQRQYRDLNLNFSINPFTKDVNKRLNDDAIKASIVNLIRTKKYERPFHPEISGEIEGTLFENFTPITQAYLKKAIETVIRKFEPRAEIIGVEVNGDRIDNNEINVKITFRIVNTLEPITVSVVLSRAR